MLSQREAGKVKTETTFKNFQSTKEVIIRSDKSRGIRRGLPRVVFQEAIPELSISINFISTALLCDIETSQDIASLAFFRLSQNNQKLRIRK